MNDIEVWKPHPEFWFVEVSTLSRVRTLDRYVNQGNKNRFVKGQILKQYGNRGGYLYVVFKVNGKTVNRKVHRLVAQTFIPNPDNLPEINHKDNDKTNNCVNNLEWCTHEYNIAYREKYGVALNRPLYAVNLKTLEVLQFRSQSEASRGLGIKQPNINGVIKGRYKQAGGYWFTEDESKITKDKLNEIKAGILCKSDMISVSLKTTEVLQFPSQRKAGRELGVTCPNINAVLKGNLKQAGGYWFTYADENAVENTRNKFGDVVADQIEELMNEKEMQSA